MKQFFLLTFLNVSSTLCSKRYLHETGYIVYFLVH
jgi:hypothetical protein